MPLPNNTVDVYMMCADNLDAAFHAESDGDYGVNFRVSKDNTIYPNLVIGRLALCLHGLMQVYQMEGRLSGHWRDLLPMLTDALDFNEDAIVADWRAGDLPDDGELLQ